MESRSRHLTKVDLSFLISGEDEEGCDAHPALHRGSYGSLPNHPTL